MHLKVFFAQGQVGCSDIFFSAFGAAGAGDRDDVVALREQPRKRQLRDRRAFVPS